MWYHWTSLVIRRKSFHEPLLGSHPLGESKGEWPLKNGAVIGCNWETETFSWGGEGWSHAVWSPTKPALFEENFAELTCFLWSLPPKLPETSWCPRICPKHLVISCGFFGDIYLQDLLIRRTRNFSAGAWFNGATFQFPFRSQISIKNWMGPYQRTPK